MKYWLLAGIGVIAGLSAGFAVTKLEFANAEDYFVIYSAPAGQKPGTDTDLENAPLAKVVNGEEYKFGAMEKNETESHAFVFRNEGKTPLTLQTIRTTCKCTISNLDKETVAPGEEVEVVLEWKPISYSRSFSQTASIKTNDPLHEIIDLRVTGRVIQPAWSVPETVVFTSILSSEGAETDFFIFGRDEGLSVEDWKMKESELSEFVDVSYEPIASDSPMLEEQTAGSGVKVHVKVKPGLPLKPLMATLQLDTNLPGDEPMDVELRGAVKGVVTINADQGAPWNPSTSTLSLGLVPQGANRRATLRLIIRGEENHDMEMRIAENGVIPAGSLKAELGEPRKRGKYMMVPLIVDVPDDAEPVSLLGTHPSQLGSIEIETTHETDKKIVIYVKFAAEGK